MQTQHTDTMSTTTASFAPGSSSDLRNEQPSTTAANPPAPIFPLRHPAYYDVEMPITFPPHLLFMARSPPQKMADRFMESPIVKGAGAYVMGYGLGLMFGFMTGSMELSDPTKNYESMSQKEHLIDGLKSSGRRALSMAKSFSVAGGVFAFSEAVIEKVRRFRTNMRLSIETIVSV